MRGLIAHLVERQASGPPPVRIRPLAPLAMPEPPLRDILRFGPVVAAAPAAVPAPRAPDASGASRGLPSDLPARPPRLQPDAEPRSAPPPPPPSETPRGPEPQRSRMAPAQWPAAPALPSLLRPPTPSIRFTRPDQAEDSGAARARATSDPGLASPGRATPAPEGTSGDVIGDPAASSPDGDRPQARRRLDDAPAAEPPTCLRPRLPEPTPERQPKAPRRAAGPPEGPETTVHVTIGRIEILSPPPRPATAARPGPRRPALSLGDYLARRGGER